VEAVLEEVETSDLEKVVVALTEEAVA